MKIPENWEVRDGTLWRRFEFEDFVDALEFVNKVGVLAEMAEHHPDITLGWGYAEMSLITHDASKITEKDTALAIQISNI